MTAPIRAWTNQEMAYLEKNAATKTLRVMARALGRSESSVERKLRTNKLRCANAKPRSDYLAPERGEMPIEKLMRANELHLLDLKRAGHTWWHRVPPAEADTLPTRISVSDSTFSYSSCFGSPSAMCVD